MPRKAKPPASATLNKKQLRDYEKTKNAALKDEKTIAGRRSSDPDVVLADARKAAVNAVKARQAEASPALRKTIRFALRGNRTV